MYRLYLVLKDRKTPATEEKISIAQGRKALNAAAAANYLVQLENASANLVQMFNQQNQQSTVRF